MSCLHDFGLGDGHPSEVMTFAPLQLFVAQAFADHFGHLQAGGKDAETPAKIPPVLMIFDGRHISIYIYIYIVIQIIHTFRHSNICIYLYIYV